MKNLIIITGTIGVGKSNVCRHLRDSLNATAYLDGEWCWNVHPMRENQNAMLDNAANLLSTYLNEPEVENIIFDWSVYDEDIINALLTRLNGKAFKLHKFTLICSEDVLRSRLVYDITAGRREASVVAESVARMPFFEKMDAIKIDIGQYDDLAAAQFIASKL